MCAGFTHRNPLLLVPDASIGIVRGDRKGERTGSALVNVLMLTCGIDWPSMVC